MVKLLSSNYRVIRTNFWGVRIFRKFTVFLQWMHKRRHDNVEPYVSLEVSDLDNAQGQPPVLPYWYIMGMCPQKAHFRPWQLLQTPLFRPVQFEKILLFKKMYVSLLFLVPKPRFSRGASSESPPFSVKGHSLNPYL